MINSTKENVSNTAKNKVVIEPEKISDSYSNVSMNLITGISGISFDSTKSFIIKKASRFLLRNKAPNNGIQLTLLVTGGRIGTLVLN